MPTINDDSCGRALHSATKGVKEVLAHAEHGKYFKRMLQDWVQQERSVVLYGGVQLLIFVQIWSVCSAL